jgi:hypothetical protein
MIRYAWLNATGFGDPVPFSSRVTKSRSRQDVVCCDHALAVNSIMNVMKRVLAELSS